MSYEVPISTATITGAVALKPAVDSTASFLIQNAAGSNIMRFDTTNNYTSSGVAGAPNSTLTVSRNSTVIAPVVPDSFHLIGADAANVRVQIDSFGAGVSTAIIGRAAGGTAATPSTTPIGTSMVSLQGRGYLATQYSNNLGMISIDAEEAYTDSTAKTCISFRTTAAGTVSAVERMRLDGAGHLGIGTITPAASALVELSSTTGALLLSRMTTAQRDALTPVNGMIIYNTTTAKFQGYEAGAWTNLI